MALAEAILVCLTERPMSGYDLAKNFDASIGFFWRASHQQIYRELGRLREKGYVVIKDDMLVKFYALENIDLDALKDQLTIRMEQHQTKLGKYYRIREKHYAGKKLDLTQKGKLIALEMGINQENQTIQLLEEAMEKIGAL